MSSDKFEDTFKIDDKTAKVLTWKGYKLKKRLSAGAFGQVYTALNKKGEICAVKMINLDKVSDKFKVKFLPRELSALIAVRHENIIKIYDIFKSRRRIYIFMEFASNGTISDFLKKNGALTEPHACVWFTQSTDALRFLHDQLKIAHRDIKIDNILLDENDIAKLTDFGFAKESVDKETNEMIVSETFCGTEPYYSPQIVMRKPYNPFLADVWAMGVVLFAMLNNKFPFHFGDARVMLREQKDPNHIRKRYVKEFSKEYKQLQEDMFEVNEKERISCSECLESEWVKKRGQCEWVKG